MKKKFYLFNLILICLTIISTFFCSCSNTKNNLNAKNMVDSVAYELSQIDGVSEMSDEQIKALSVVVRTKQKSGQNSDIPNSCNAKIDDRISMLVSKTQNEVLLDNENLANVYYSSSSENEIWHENIKKSKILNYMMNNGISLSNISNVMAEYNEDGTLKNLNIGGREISYIELERNFNLKSNKITDVKNNSSSISVTGTTNLDKNCLYFSKLKDFNDQNYKEILKQYYNNYDLKTI